MTVKPEDIKFVDIFPPINVARVGGKCTDSNEYFISSEVPGVEPIPEAQDIRPSLNSPGSESTREGGFKDKDYKIRKQAARFRVYAFDKDSKPLGEITSENYSLTWTVHVANKKAAWVVFRGRYQNETWRLRNKDVQGWPSETDRNYEYTNTRTKLIIDSGEQVIEGKDAEPVALQGEFQGSLDSPIKVQLGELRTDEHGRLLVLASDGHSFSVRGDQELNSEFDSVDWVDNMCDGTIRVTVKSNSHPELTIPVKNRATIITAPPRFASGTHCPTTLYDLIENIYAQQPGGNGNDGEVVYYRDIYPLFKRIYLLSWTNKHAKKAAGHGADNMDYWDSPDFSDPAASENPRKTLFGKIRLYVDEASETNRQERDQQAKAKFMPRLAGDGGDATPGERNTWQSLTQLQYARLKKWSQGQFTTGQQDIPYPSFDKIPLELQPDALTRSALEWSVGAALYPGIEVFWHAQFAHSYLPIDEHNPTGKYRYADTVTPGDLGKGLCLPWQSDFNMCSTDWWPSVRPDDVVTEKYYQNVANVTPPPQLATSLTARVPWARGIEGETLQAKNSDMVRKWTKLGFVARQRYDQEPDNREVLVERQRDPNFPPLN
ncbi:hypothetical protein FRC12_005847 [Ceratobasidium sp. 428]|nr:hypothetical protein FRC12_005847 [Ceratobasidium sp. 428]